MLRRGGGARATFGGAHGFLTLGLLACCGTLVAGCGVTRGELDAAGGFGKSAAQLADGAKAAYGQTAADERDLRTIKYVVLSSNEIAHRGYRRPLVDVSESKIKGRLAAAEALSAYGTALTTLLDSKSQESDFSTAAAGLIGAIKGIPTKTLADAHITTAQIDSFGKVVVVLGDFYLDYRRREVLEEVVPAAEPVVTRICNMFAADFDVSQKGILGAAVYTELGETKGNLITALDVVAAREVENKAGAGRQETDTRNFQARAALLPLYQRVDALNSRITVSFGSLKKAAESCAKTSVKLRDAVKDRTVSLEDIEDFATKAQAAYNAIHEVVGSK